MTNDEVFRPIPGFSNYRVSNRGRVQSRYGKNGRFLGSWRDMKLQTEPDGRTRVNIKHDGGRVRTIRVATLVLLAFIGPPRPHQKACHFPDRNKSNNRLENLRWGTRGDNMQDAMAHGTFPLGEKHYSAKLREGDVRMIRRLSMLGQPKRELARQYAVSPRTIQDIVTYDTWRHLGHS
jgi:hypothetical protein